MISNDRLKKIREYCGKATPAPWSYNSYSRIAAPRKFDEDERVWDEYQAAGEPEDGRGHPLEPWRTKLYDADSEVATVPAIGGDTASGQHACDAVFIAEARQDLPALVEELERCRKALRQITEVSLDHDYYEPGTSPAEAMKEIAYGALPVELEGT